jgi:glycosyltransferase involved in cell wall biosynthesis
LVYTVHNVLPHGAEERHRNAYQEIYGMCDRLICHDPEAARRLEVEFGVDPVCIEVIPHGPLFEVAPAGGREEARSRLGFAKDECVVLWQGILKPYKGVSFLLKAWRRVCARPVRARLTIVGTGAEDIVKATRDEVAALGIGDNVRLELRFVSRAELADFYEAADVLVYPYSEITTSGALMTGIVRGKAIVATDLPAFRHALHGDTALLVPYGDVEELSGTLLRLIADEDLRRELGERLRTRAEVTSWPEIARQTARCYRSVLSNRRVWVGRPVGT